MLEVVLFDLGSTLLYFDGVWPDVTTEADRTVAITLRQAGYELDETSFIPRVRERLTAYYQQRDSEFIEVTTLYVLRSLLADFGYPEAPESTLQGCVDAMYAVSQAHWRREEDAIPTLEALRWQGYRMGIISNAGDDRDVQTLIDNAGLRPYFDFIITSARAGFRKPNPRIFKMALDFFQVSPQQAVMVGDTLGADILGAKNVGLRSVWITRRADTPDNRDHLDTIQPDAVVATLAELPGVLAGF